jgi:hypothetical protein
MCSLTLVSRKAKGAVRYVLAGNVYVRHGMLTLCMAVLQGDSIETRLNLDFCYCNDSGRMRDMNGHPLGI